ncbi:MAG: hypothetical protein A2Y10_15765 [Planctomycetes bacterium GWF2_41_51]|nr:MAG: hypothetical protein A2Y10_15765 [Planctomycetes bacterium GWF2_41_51]HBG27611.1 hypothetical protein [Phycisphaerales bacterium]
MTKQHPHQLRHNAATFLRKEFGLETARIILGHKLALITEVYAEMDQQRRWRRLLAWGRFVSLLRIDAALCE